MEIWVSQAADENLPIITRRESDATFIAAGPAFKKGLRNKLPTGNVDIAPTIAHLLGYKPAETMQGRVLQEVLQDGSVTNVNAVKNKTIVVAGESVVLKASLEVLGRYTYLNYVETQRK